MRNVVILDIETTGFSPVSGDKIIEIGAIKMLDDNVVGIFNTLINPRRDIPPKITELTGITNEMVKKAPPAVDVVTTLIKFIGTDTVVTHNVSFDRAFLEHTFMSAGFKKRFEYFCTLNNARKNLKNVPGYKLQILKYHFNLLEIGDIHRALADSFVTAQLYLILIGKFTEQTPEKLRVQMEHLLDKQKESQSPVVI